MSESVAPDHPPQPLPPSQLLAACSRGDVAAVSWFVERDPETLCAPDTWYTLVDNGREQVLELRRRTPLQVAATFGSLDCVSYLLSAGADVTTASPDDGASALHCAAAAGAWEATSLLISYGAPLDARDAAGRLPRDVALQSCAPHPHEPPPHGGFGISAQRLGTFVNGAGPGRYSRAPVGWAARGAMMGAQGGPSAPPPPPHVEALLLDQALLASPGFNMFEFKVRRCPNLRAHDWMECPYTHAGEKAQRRDPRLYAYSATSCIDFKKSGSCGQGERCKFAHGVFEAWLHPSAYRTVLCNDGESCSRRICFFAHSPAELRSPAAEAAAVSTEQAAASREAEGDAASSDPAMPTTPDSGAHAENAQRQPQRPGRASASAVDAAPPSRPPKSPGSRQGKPALQACRRSLPPSQKLTTAAEPVAMPRAFSFVKLGITEVVDLLAEDLQRMAPAASGDEALSLAAEEVPRSPLVRTTSA